MNRIKRRVQTQLFLVAMVLFVAACGQRGPLYLPEPEQEPAKTNETEANETEANETEANETEANETEANETEANETEANETEADETEDDRERKPGTE